MIISWLKLDVNILDDAKVKIIRSHPDGDKVFVLWIGLLCLAMKSSRPGIIEISDGLPYTPDDLSHLFDIEIKTVEMGIALFRKYKMVDILDGNVIEIINFSKHQKLDNIEHTRELTRQRTIAYRKRLRNSDENVTRHAVTVTPTDIDIERDIEIELDKENTLADKPPKRTRKIFKIPTVEEIASYCNQRNNGIDPQYFWDYQQARDWILSNGKRMVDWQATVRTWERNNISNGFKKPINETSEKQVSPYVKCESCGAEVLKGDFIEENGKRRCSKCPVSSEKAKSEIKKIMNRLGNQIQLHGG